MEHLSVCLSGHNETTPSQMKAFIAQSWNYSALIYNVVADRWESLDHVFPGTEHAISADKVATEHVAAELCAEREKALFRTIELSEVPEAE